MSVILPGSPEPGLEGESKEYIKFAESMTPQKTDQLADRLIAAYKKADQDVDTQRRT